MLRGARTSTVVKAFKTHDIQATFDKSPNAQKCKRAATRANLNDFERFTVMVNRKRRSALVRGVKDKSGKKK